MKKRLVVLAAALSMSMGLSMVSYAGNWQHDSKGTWYLTDDWFIFCRCIWSFGF